MSLAHKRKPIGFFGMLIVIIIAIGIVYLLITTITNHNVNKIAKINDKYMVTRNDLIPDEHGGYVVDLKTIGTSEAQIIIDYVYLTLEARKLDRAVRYAITENGCITRNTIARIETQIQNRDKVLNSFKNTYSKKLNKIYWDTYIDILENRYQIDILKKTARALPFC